MKQMENIVRYLCIASLDAFFIGGAAYLVFWRHENPWWMLLGVLLAGSTGPWDRKPTTSDD